MKYDLGCGPWKMPGFYGIDIEQFEGVDEVCDLMQLPWPIADGSAEEIRMSHFLEHITIPIDDVVQEVHRVLQPNGTFTIILPNLRGAGAFNPGHTLWIDEEYFMKNTLFQSLFTVKQYHYSKRHTELSLVQAVERMSQILGIPVQMLDRLLWNTFHQVEIICTKKEVVQNGID